MCGTMFNLQEEGIAGMGVGLTGAGYGGRPARASPPPQCSAGLSQPHSSESDFFPPYLHPLGLQHLHTPIL